MKTSILCLIGVATLFLTNGCMTHDQGASYGTTEYETGTYHSHYGTYPRYDRYGYWDQYGTYHPDTFPQSRGQHDWGGVR
jgi:hypothetical protein